MARLIGDLTTPQIFGIIVLMLGIVIAASSALWLKGYGVDIIHLITGFAPGVYLSKGNSNQKSGAGKGLSANLPLLELIGALLLIATIIYIVLSMGII